MKIKKGISIFLAACILSSLTGVFAADVTDSRAVIGADLTDENVEDVYGFFGLDRGSVDELTVTNAEEREYLEGYVDDSLIGTRSISCVYIEMLPEGSGLDVTTSNINWCEPAMYVSALATAGITDAKVVVAAPFEVSGTAALTGVYLAYEDITGETLSEEAKLVSTQELTLTADLADEIGSYDSVEIVNELKLILAETKEMTDEELRAKIDEIAEEYNVSLTDSQTDQLINLCRSLEKLNAEELKAKVESVQETIKKMTEAKTKIQDFTESLKNITAAIAEFFQRIFSRFTKD
ncbi:MAG: DUF1002 domain-containing protein [Clostridia bacterium]|nr:DUF1002 domain-containing protein [Clostridia bacterium]